MKTCELRDKIYQLEKELEYQERIFEVKEQRIRLDEQGIRNTQKMDLFKAQAENEQLKARIVEHPYKLVSDMLKALVVKFPTLNIKDLAISTGKK